MLSIISGLHLCGSQYQNAADKQSPHRPHVDFSHISTELTDLHGKFEIVSKDVLLLKDAIANEVNKLSKKVDNSQKSILEKVEYLFDRKFLSIAGSIVGALILMFGAVTFLQSHGITGNPLGWVSVIGGFGLLLIVWLIVRRKQSS